jgi:hypothetical protein
LTGRLTRSTLDRDGQGELVVTPSGADSHAAQTALRDPARRLRPYKQPLFRALLAPDRTAASVKGASTRASLPTGQFEALATRLFGALLR